MKTTIKLRSGGELIIQPSATRQSVQLTHKPITGPSIGLLIPTHLAGIAAQAIEACGTLNEEHQNPPELPAHALQVAA